MLANNAACKHETPYEGPFLITQCCTNSTVTLQYCLVQISHNILQIYPYISDTNVEDITYDDVKILSPFIYFCILLNFGYKIYNRIHTGTLELINIVCASEVFHYNVIFFTMAVSFKFR